MAMMHGCTGRSTAVSLPFDQIAEGDLAFRCGRGVMSRAVTAAEGDGIYSHIGLLFKEGDKWVVVHAVPGEKESTEDFDRVKAESTDVFFCSERAKRGCLVHTGLRDSAAVASMKAAALRMARDSVRFDHDYNLEDSTAVYCTELVWRLYRAAGIDLAEGRSRNVHLLHIDGECLLPEHLLNYSNNERYYQF